MFVALKNQFFLIRTLFSIFTGGKARLFCNVMNPYLKLFREEITLTYKNI